MKIMIFIILLSACIFSKNKYTNFKKTPVDTIEYDEFVIEIGNLHNYVTNSTYLYNDPGWGSSQNKETFIIGDATWSWHPSMSWLSGGYIYNYYISYGTFRIGYNNSTIKFSTETSHDFKVTPNDIDIGTPLIVTFSMTDGLAGINKIGIKCICKVYAWESDIIDDFFIFEYSIINNSNIMLEDIYAGFHSDCDLSLIGESDQRPCGRDDIVDFSILQNGDNEVETISYMWDGDNPNIYGDDTGGHLTPKESLGYIGSRVLTCPPSNNGVAANQQSGHQWWDWNNDPESDSSWYSLMAKEEFKMKPLSPHDYRYFQTIGPWDIPVGDTIVVAIGFGIGVGLEGLRTNLQYAYNLYHSFGKEPKITDFSPKVDTLKLEMGESQQFSISAKNGENFIYRWINNDKLFNFDKTYLEFTANKFTLGTIKIVASVSDNQYTSYQKWIVEVVPAKKYELAQNYPNPFNGVTTIPFELQKDGNVNITIYDVLGRKVKTLINKPYTFGKHIISWDGTDANGNDISSGIYLYRIKSNNYSKTKRLLLLR
jgi:type IX secretion system substrate protein